MAVNIFEGARRITKLSVAVWVACWVLAAFFIGIATTGALIAVGGMVFIFGLSYAVGWIMRGFLFSDRPRLQARLAIILF